MNLAWERRCGCRHLHYIFGMRHELISSVVAILPILLSGCEAQGPAYEVVACIAGRGFKQRKQDMRKLLEATRGKVFTLQTLSRLVEHTRLKNFETKFVAKGT